MKDSKIKEALRSCVHECQVYSWLNWVERIDMGDPIRRLYMDLGQIKLDELHREMDKYERST